MHFPPKKDTLPIAIITACSLFTIALGTYMFWEMNTLTGRFVAGFIILTGLFLQSLISSLQYEVSANILFIRQWPLRWKIPLKNIVHIRASKESEWSSGVRPALSQQLLHIQYKASGGIQNEVQISPADRESFLNYLLENDSGLYRIGEEIYRQEMPEVHP